MKKIPKEGRVTPTRGARAGMMLCALHVWTVFAIALSNWFGVFTLLSTLWAGRAGAPSFRRVRQVVVPFCLLVGLWLAAMVASTNRATSLDEASELWGFLTLPVCLFLIRGPRDTARVIDGLVFMAVLSAGYGILQGVGGDFADLHTRVRGPFSHYMTFSGVVLLANVVLIAQMLYGRLRSWWLALPLFLLTLGLAVSLTRGAWLALILTVILMVCMNAPRWLAIVPLLALLFVLVASGFLVRRMGSIVDLENETNRERVRITRAGLRMVAERPLLGHGPGVAREIYPRFAEPTAIRMNVEHLHNSYLQIAAENGLPTLGVFLWFLWSPLRRSFRGLQETGFDRRQAVSLASDPDGTPQVDRGRPSIEDRREARAIFAAAFFGLIAFGLAALFEDNWSDVEVQRIALFLVAAPFCLRISSVRSRG